MSLGYWYFGCWQYPARPKPNEWKDGGEGSDSEDSTETYWGQGSEKRVKATSKLLWEVVEYFPVYALCIKHFLCTLREYIGERYVCFLQRALGHTLEGLSWRKGST